jgi:predicted dehydrogenase
MEAMWTRFLPHQIELRQRLEDGELGEIVAAHADMGGRDPYNPDGRMYSPYLGGGALLDRGIYPISWLVDLLGLPGDIHAVAQMTDTGVDGHTAMTLGWPARETTATAQASILTITPHLGWLAGTRALVRVPNFWEPTRLEFVFPDGRVDTWQWEGVRARGWEYMLAAVARSVADGATVNPLMPPEQSVAIMGLLDAVRSQIGLVWPTA